MKKTKYLQLFWSIFLFLVLGCSGGDEDSTIKVTSISVSPTSLSMDVDDSDNLSAVIMPSDAYNKDVTWTSDNQSVVMVNDIGSVKAIAPGEANIKVITRDGAKSAVCKVTVKKPDQTYVAVESIALDKSTLTLGLDNTTTLTATILPENASIMTITWTSSDKEIVTVDKGGLKAIKPGTATITATATDGGFNATCEVTVESVNVTSVDLNQNSTSVDIGEFIQLVATIEPANASNQNVSWSSSGTKVATVDASGKVTGVDKGTAIITVTTENGNKIATCEVEVVKRVTGIQLSESKIVIAKGNTHTGLTATVLPSDASNLSYNWKIENEDIATLTITSGGITISGKQGGLTRITATTTDGDFKASCDIVVTCSNSIPAMTSSTEPSGEVLFSNLYVPMHDPFYVFDNDNSTYWESPLMNRDDKIIYIFPAPTMINVYRLLPFDDGTGKNPKAFKLEASNSDEDNGWVTLHEINNVTSLTYQTYEFENNTFYKKYRINITESNGATHVGIKTLEMGYSDH